MKVATAAQMREIDNKAIGEYGIPGVALMENAGGEVARKVEAVLGEVIDKKICIFAGKGNNGGDGFVAARRLTGRGAKVKVFLLGDKAEVGGDARVNLDVLLRTGADVVEVAGERDIDKAKFAAAFSDCLIDALVGTGFRGEIGGIMADVVEVINTAGKPVVAVDIPSGIDADTGQVRGVAVQATYTVTFALPKPGLLFQPGACHSGQIDVVDIGLPVGLIIDEAIRQNTITAQYVRGILPSREPWAHKGDNGRVAAVAGSTGMTGAAALLAGAALRAGAGLVTLGVAASLNPIMEVKLTEAMTVPLPEGESGALGIAAVPIVAELASICDVLAVGPGLGQAIDTQAAVRHIIKEAGCPLVLDADALNALVGYTDTLFESEALAVLTPHPGELSRLTGLPVQTINADRTTAAREAAARWGTIIVLKGPGTVVAFPDGEVFINTTGNAGMATGGTGDVLTGVIAGLIAQGMSSHDAAVAGVYIHGLAGDIVARRGLAGMTAGDLLEAIPGAAAIVRGGELS